MTRRRILKSEAFENETIFTRARVVREATGLPLAPSDCSSYRVKVFDLGHPTAPQTAIYDYGPQSAVSDILSGTLRTTGWTLDSTGYNLEHQLSPSNSARIGGHTYRIEIAITCSEGSGIIPVVHECGLVPLWGSGD